MADKDRSKYLLSKEALPKVRIPKASEHKKRAFALPQSMSRGAAPAPRPAQRVEPSAEEGRRPSHESAARTPTPAREKPSEIAPQSPDLEIAAEETAPSAEGAPGETPTGKGKRADSTLRFKDRTLGWFRAGDDLADEEESEEYEPEVSGGPRAALWVAAGVLALVGAAVAIWQLS